MTRAIRGWRLAATAGAVALAAAPALADVKAGVEAWNRGDYARAVAEWRGPALAGDPDAQFNMGQAYKLGRAVPADLAQAEVWYQKAAAQGHAQAQANYGLALFQDGRKADALPWLEKSAAHDEKRTELVLGTMLFNGDTVSKDWVRAYALVSRSSQQGVPQASQALAQMDGFLSPEQRQQGIAVAQRIADEGRSAQIAALSGASAASDGEATGTRVRGSTPAGPPHHAARTDVEIPASTATPRFRSTGGSGTDEAAAADKPARPAMPAPRAKAPPTPRATAPAVTRPAITARGHWRVQLGAFRDEGNARSLWARIGGRVGGQPSYLHVGGVTRLQAGPFASKADAERACHASGTSCVVVP